MAAPKRKKSYRNQKHLLKNKVRLSNITTWGTSRNVMITYYQEKEKFNKMYDISKKGTFQNVYYIYKRYNDYLNANN